MVILNAAGTAADSEQSGQKATTTLMIYMCGSDLESRSGAATKDIYEMLASKFNTDYISLLIMTGGARDWKIGFDANTASIVEVGKRGIRTMWRSEEMMSMADSKTLTAFLDYGYTHYPADRYALIVWDHGAGPNEGSCADELFSGEMLTLDDFRRALEESPFKQNPLSWIGFDACLMGTVEVASCCAPYAGYLIASQEIEPSTGWNYRFLKGLEEDRDGSETGERIIESYFSGGEGGKDRSFLTLSCIDLSKIEEVREKTDGMFTQLNEIMDEEHFAEISNHRRDARALGRGTTGAEYDLVDLKDLAGQYRETAPVFSKELEAAVEEAVVHQRSSAERVNGLSIYYPFYNKEYYRTGWEDSYHELGFADKYTEYLGSYCRFWLGESLADFDGLTVEGQYNTVQHVQHLQLPLTDEQAEHFSSAEVTILGESFISDGYFYIYTIDDVNLREDQVAEAEYQYESLYLLDENGEAISRQLPYKIIEDNYFIRVLFETISMDDYFFSSIPEKEYDTMGAWLRCRRNEDTGELEILGIVTGLENELNTGKQEESLDPEQWPVIAFFNEPYIKITDEEEQIRPFFEWPSYSEANPDGFAMYIEEVPYDSGWSLRFMNVQSDGLSLYAQYTVWNTQEEAFGSELFPIDNPNRTSSFDSGTVLMDTEEVRAVLTGIDTIASNTSPGVYLRFEATNSTDEEVVMEIDDLYLNQTKCPFIQNDHINTIDPGKTQSAYFCIEPEWIPYLEEDSIRNLKFTLKVSKRDESYQRTELGETVFDGGVSVQLGALANEALEDPEIFAEGTFGSAQARLLNLSENENGDLDGILYINNPDSELLSFNLYPVSSKINGYWFRNNIRFRRGIPGTISIQTGCDIYLPVTIGASTNPADGYSFSGVDVPATDGRSYWGITELNSIELRVEKLSGSSRTGRIVLQFIQPWRWKGNTLEGTERTELLSIDGIKMNLTDISIEGNSLVLDGDLGCEGYKDADFCYSQVYVNGNPKNVWTGVEFGEEYSLYGYIMDGPEDGFTRWRMKIMLPEEDADGKEIETVTVPLRLMLGNGQEYCISPIRINFPEPVSAADRSGTIDRERYEVISGEAQEPVTDPFELFRSEVDILENCRNSGVMLQFVLPEEQTEEIEETYVILCTEEEESFTILGILPAETEGSCVRTSFPGFLCASENGRVLSQRVTGEESTTCFEILNGRLRTIDNKYQDIDLLTITWKEGEKQAHIADLSIGGEYRTTSHFLWADFLLMTRYAAADKDSEYFGRFEDWNRTGFTKGYTMIPGETDGKMSFSFVEAEKIEGLKVLLSVRNKDGSGYVLPPVPYDSVIIGE